MLRINLLVPTTGLTGGIKVIFWHANGLAKRGHQVTVIHPLVLLKKATIKDKFRGVLKFFKYQFLKLINQDRIRHFDLDSKIKIIRVANLSERFIPDADITVATANETADWLIDYSSAKGKKFYFIQDYETWTRSPQEVEDTWKMPLKKIVISSWLKDLAENKFQEKIYGIVPDGLDFNIFIDQPKVFNKDKRILMQYHRLPKKGLDDGLRAFRFARSRHPEIKLVLYGATPPPQSILKEIEKFYYRPTVTEVRNIFWGCDIFLWPSRVEGFGLPPMEAMACRCAVIATDTGALRDYAVDGQTAVIVPPLYPFLMAKKLIKLIEDEERLKRMTEAARHKILEFSWEKSTQKLEEIFLSETKK